MKRARLRLGIAAAAAVSAAALWLGNKLSSAPEDWEREAANPRAKRRD